ncbi:MAG: hypothetical protein COA88_07940 [Kordia sp.]|nr:MAG: hypothetical protein COA88_07940 [Kordia sp.]
MRYIYLILFLTAQLLSGQETISEFDLELKGLRSKRNVFSIVENDRISLFFDNKKEMKCYLLDNNKTVSSEFIFDRPHRKYKNILGYITEGDHDFLYFGNKKKNSFAVLDVNFKTKNSSVQEIDLKLEGVFLDAFSINKKFYLLSLTDNSVLNLYCLNNRTTVSLSKYPIDKKIKLGENLIAYSGLSLVKNLEKIENNTPNSIENTSSYNKIYTTDSEVIITLDVNDKFTRLIKIDFNRNKAVIEKIEHITVAENKERSRSNSFFHQGKLYQLSATRKNLAFSYYDLETKERSKVIKLNVNDSIWFKNSDIIQEKTDFFNSERKLSKTKQFLRKVAFSKPGISIVSVNGTNQITIGGVSEIANGGGFMMGGAVSGAIGGMTSVYMSPTFYSYGSYSSTKSTFINCLFDNMLGHKEGEFKDNAFDKIKAYEDSVYHGLKLKTVFKYQNKYIFGYYSGDKYNLRVFNH